MRISYPTRVFNDANVCSYGCASAFYGVLWFLEKPKETILGNAASQEIANRLPRDSQETIKRELRYCQETPKRKSSDNKEIARNSYEIAKKLPRDSREVAKI